MSRDFAGGCGERGRRAGLFVRLVRRLRGGLGAVSVVACLLAAGEAAAQDAGIMAPGFAAVTAFSGAIPDPAATDSGGDPADHLIIDPNGPAARIIDLTGLGSQGALSDADKALTVSAGQVGQVFGVALDDAAAPNLYLAASSAYGLPIGIADPSGGSIQRLMHGTPGAVFLPNLFGPDDQGGGPGSIWRVDGETGEVALFADVDSDGGPNTGAALGALAFDPRSRQLFAADRGTGLIHRFGLDGADRGSFDHGVAGRPAGGLDAVAYDPAGQLDITSQSFDTADPESWGLASPPRRIFGLAAHERRLYYAVAEGPEIWSVGIAADGGFEGDARLEVQIEALEDGVEISQIAFDARGLLYAAERAPPTGAYDFVDLASGGQTRVLRFHLKRAGDPPSPGLWSPDEEQYAIGLLPQYQNADGGVALGNGYRNGRLEPGACGVTLWSTGDRLLDPGEAGESPDSYDRVDGLQGNDNQLVEPQNTPPIHSWFVDYFDSPADVRSQGHMGAIAVLNLCGRAAVAPPVYRERPPIYAPPPIRLYCPPGTSRVGDQCLVTLSCPPGSYYDDGYCVYESCPRGTIQIRGDCVPPPIVCRRGEVFLDGLCIPLGCPRDLILLRNGYCGCPRDELFFDGRCLPPRDCPPGLRRLPGGVCGCPFGTRYDDGYCRPPPLCPPPTYFDGRRCVPPPICRQDEIFIHGRCVPPRDCPPWTERRDGRCVPIGCPRGERFIDGKCRPPRDCPEGTIRRGRDCVPDRCPRGEIYIDGECRPPRDCPEGTIRRGRDCVPDRCPRGEIYIDGECRPPRDCPEGTIRRGRDCVPDRCPRGEIYIDGECRPPRDCPQGTIRRGRECVPERCPSGQIVIDGQCRPARPDCPQGTIRRGGECVPERCPSGQIVIDGQCRPARPDCPQGTIRRGGECVPERCPSGQIVIDGQCRPARPDCPQGTVRSKRGCLPIGQDCPSGQIFADGKCRPSRACPDGTVRRGDKCVPSRQPECGPDEVLVRGACRPRPDQRPDCKPGQIRRRGQCVDAGPNPRDCGPGEVFRNGQCVARPTNNGGGDCSDRDRRRGRCGIVRPGDDNGVIKQPDGTGRKPPKLRQPDDSGPPRIIQLPNGDPGQSGGGGQKLRRRPQAGDQGDGRGEGDGDQQGQKLRRLKIAPDNAPPADGDGSGRQRQRRGGDNGDGGNGGNGGDGKQKGKRGCPPGSDFIEGACRPAG